MFEHKKLLKACAPYILVFLESPVISQQKIIDSLCFHS